MGRLNDIIDVISFIPEVKRQTTGIIKIGGEGIGLTASQNEDIYILAAKVLYIRYTGDFTTYNFPVDSSAIGYNDLNNKYLNVLAFENYKDTYGMIDDIIRNIKRDISASVQVYSDYEEMENKTIWDNNAVGSASVKYFPVIDSSTVVSMNKFKKNATALEMVGYLDISNVEDMTEAFTGCTNLEVLNLYGLKTDLDLSTCTNLSMDSAEYIIMNAQTVKETKTLTLPSSLINNLTTYYRNVASEKNWTLS